MEPHYLHELHQTFIPCYGSIILLRWYRWWDQQIVEIDNGSVIVEAMFIELVVASHCKSIADRCIVSFDVIKNSLNETTVG